jgi:hypothetical protein
MATDQIQGTTQENPVAREPLDTYHRAKNRRVHEELVPYFNDDAGYRDVVILSFLPTSGSGMFTFPTVS